MTEIRLVPTSAGPVEVALVPGTGEPVLFFPGGHCSARVDCGWSIYTNSDHPLVSFSRPGYGRTDVGSIGPAAFALLVGEVCQELAISEVAAAVGVSYGGMQAVHTALLPDVVVRRLVLHSAAPSTLAYPDSRAQAIGGSIIFSTVLEAAVWRLLHRLVRTETGLRFVMGPLSTLPLADWWDRFTASDRDEVRAVFRSMSSDAGFVNDLRDGRASGSNARRRALSAVSCPTLVTGSPHDGGVAFAHAVDLADNIPSAVLEQLDSPSHIFWIGPGKDHLVGIVESFLAE